MSSLRSRIFFRGLRYHEHVNAAKTENSSNDFHDGTLNSPNLSYTGANVPLMTSVPRTARVQPKVLSRSGFRRNAVSVRMRQRPEVADVRITLFPTVCNFLIKGSNHTR